MVKFSSGCRLGLVVFSIGPGLSPLGATSVAGSLTVSAVVEQACHLDVRPLRFDTLRDGAPRGDADGALAVACTPDTAFVVTMDDGQHRAGGTRRMSTPGGDFLAYELYSDAARTRRWGGGLADSVSGQISDGSAVTLPIYGRVEAASATTGSYADIVTVTVSF